MVRTGRCGRPDEGSILSGDIFLFIENLNFRLLEKILIMNFTLFVTSNNLIF